MKCVEGTLGAIYTRHKKIHLCLLESIFQVLDPPRTCGYLIMKLLSIEAFKGVYFISSWIWMLL